MTSMQRFNKSFWDAAQFPRNLLFHDTYDDSLRRYSKRLYENQERLFCEEAGTSVDFWQRDDQATGRRCPLAYAPWFFWRGNNSQQFSGKNQHAMIAK